MTKSLNRASFLLFYILILFLPTQLGRHFFFDFSSISGIRSDYLTPTIYFTDIIAVLLIIMSLRGVPIKSGRRGNLSTCLSSYPRGIPRMARNDKLNIALIITCYLLLNVFFIAANKWAAFYKLIKIIEFIFLGIVVYRLKPKLSTLTFVFSVGVFYSSIIAIWQFLIQKSIGGVFWFLGERTFYAATPGIAALSYHGNLFLRPYATFPHPNVLGGFLAVVLPLLLFYSSNPSVRLGVNSVRSSRYARTINTWFIICLVLGLISLILSFSRAAWLVAGFGFTAVLLEKKYDLSKKLKGKKEWFLSGFYLMIISSVFVPLILPKTLFINLQYWQERTDLIRTTVSMAASHPFFGVGLNNFITQSQRYGVNFPSLYMFQPVHNIYLLIFGETGIIGLIFLLGLLAIIINRGLKTHSIFLYSLTQLFFLGFFDHYLATLQQGQLLLVIFAALTFAAKVAY